MSKNRKMQWETVTIKSKAHRQGADKVFMEDVPEAVGTFGRLQDQARQIEQLRRQIFQERSYMKKKSEEIYSYRKHIEKLEKKITQAERQTVEAEKRVPRLEGILQNMEKAYGQALKRWEES